MKRVNLIFAGLFLSIFLFAVLPMVSAGHCGDEHPDDIDSEEFCLTNINHNLRFSCGDDETKLYSHSCQWDEGLSKCIDKPGKSIDCSDTLNYKCLDSNFLSTGYRYCSELEKDFATCIDKYVYCPLGCIEGGLLGIDHCRDGVVDPYPDGTIVESEPSLPNTNPFLFKTILIIFLVVLAFVVYTYLKPKKNRSKKK